MFIYAVSAGRLGPVKIGKSYSPGSRIRSLQTSNSAKLSLIDIWRVHRTIAGIIEWQIHQQLADKRLAGEWFDVNEIEMREFMGKFMATKNAERIILNWGMS